MRCVSSRGAPGSDNGTEEHLWKSRCGTRAWHSPTCGGRVRHPHHRPSLGLTGPGRPHQRKGLHRLFDAFPSRQLGCIYCCGTRAEAGGSPLVLDEIEAFGRQSRIFMVHFRNVRGSFATAGSFEEVLLDDGDKNMLQVLRALDRVGFDGCLNPDHYPKLEGDAGTVSQALAYSVGYIKALLVALATQLAPTGGGAAERRQLPKKPSKSTS